MASTIVENNVSFIRTATYGVEVRKPIATTLEAIANLTTHKANFNRVANRISELEAEAATRIVSVTVTQISGDDYLLTFNRANGH